jgi:putative hemolysin
VIRVTEGVVSGRDDEDVVSTESTSAARRDASLAAETDRPYPGNPRGVPAWEDGFGRYRVSFAKTPEELDEVLRLRFDVFHAELGHGTEGYLRDEDVFDRSCHHLLVRCDRSGEVVGTYRLMTRTLADSAPAFYSDCEFDLSGLPDDVLQRGVELGRACIARAHRGRRVLFLLWRGIGRYLEHNRKRYLFGCASLPTMDPAEIAAHYAMFRSGGHVAEDWIPIRESFRQEGFESIATDETPAEVVVPGLVRGYLQLGANVCGGPALDRAFGTTDFFMLLDANEIPPETYRRYVR